MNKKVFIFYFKRGYCDTVCYCHMSRSSWRALVFFFFSNFQNALLSFFSYWLLKSFAFYSISSLLFYDVCKQHVYVTDAETPICPHCHSYNSGNPIGPVHPCIPPTHITPLISHPLCLLVWVYICVCERESLTCVVIFLQIIKAQIKSPHPPLMLVDCLDKPQCVSPYVFTFCANLCVWLCGCGCIVRCQQAP